MFKYPAASEEVIYNIRPGELFEGSNLESLPYVFDTEKMEPLDEYEPEYAHELVLRRVALYVNDRRLPKPTPLRWPTWSSDCIGDPTGDRTVPVISPLPLLTADFIEFVQQRILQQIPNWRLRYCEASDQPDLTLAIYPNAISVGNSPPVKDGTKQIQELRQRLEVREETVHGELIRQLREVQPLIRRKSPRHWRTAGVAALAKFEKADTAEPLQTIWLVQAGRSSAEVAVAPEYEVYLSGNVYPITRSGKIGQIYGQMWRSPTHLWVRQLECRKADLPHLYVTYGKRRTKITIQELVDQLNH
ncbi:MAG: hypothetical protein SGJ20_08125 [Planctomycetota bacterium]|nr:hypothetical protein [Planctomycetota bacterium]